MADPSKNNDALINKVLGDPSKYPDEMLAWLPRFMQKNVNLVLTAQQLPPVKANAMIGETGQPAFENGWVNYSANTEQAHYYIDPFRRVFIGGVVKAGTIPSTIFTLPAGYRPQYAMIYAVASNDLFGVVTVNADGTIRANVGSATYLSLSGINFRQFA